MLLLSTTTKKDNSFPTHSFSLMKKFFQTKEWCKTSNEDFSAWWGNIGDEMDGRILFIFLPVKWHLVDEGRDSDQTTSIPTAAAAAASSSSL